MFGSVGYTYPADFYKIKLVKNENCFILLITWKGSENMGKRERKIEAIKKYIGNAGGTWPGYSYGNIPRQQAINACNSYAGAIQVKDILGLIDITISGNGKKGMVFTEYMIYYDNGFLANRGSVSYRHIHEEGRIPSDILSSQYNQNAMRGLVSILSNIEGETLLKNTENFIDDLDEGFEQVANVVNKGLDLFNSIMNALDSDNNN